MQSHKAARARLALKKYLRLTPRNGRYTQNQLNERETFINEFFSIGPSIPIAAKSLHGSPEGSFQLNNCGLPEGEGGPLEL